MISTESEDWISYESEHLQKVKFKDTEVLLDLRVGDEETATVDLSYSSIRTLRTESSETSPLSRPCMTCGTQTNNSIPIDIERQMYFTFCDLCYSRILSAIDSILEKHPGKLLSNVL